MTGEDFPRSKAATVMMLSVTRRLSPDPVGSLDQIHVVVLVEPRCLPGKVVTSSAALICASLSSAQASGATVLVVARRALGSNGALACVTAASSAAAHTAEIRRGDDMTDSGVKGWKAGHRSVRQTHVTYAHDGRTGQRWH